MLSLLDGLSPFHWISVALLLGGAVMLLSVDMLLWPAVASLVIGLLLFFIPDLSGEMQILLFALLSVSAVIIVRFFLPRFGSSKKVGATLNDPLTRLQGRVGTLTDVSGHQGQVEIDGVKWSVRWTGGDLSQDAEVEVIGNEGSILMVQKKS